MICLPPVAPANVQMPTNVQTPANVQTSRQQMYKLQQMCKHDASKMCKSEKKTSTANVQFSILTTNVQTRDFKNNLNKLKGLESTNYIKSVKAIF